MILKKKEFSPKDSKWYGGKNAKTGDIIKILTEAKWIEKEFDGDKYQKLSCDIEVNGMRKTYDMNKSAQTSLEEAFGDDTKEWIGHKARVMVAPTPKGDSKMILLEAIVDMDENPF